MADHSTGSDDTYALSGTLLAAGSIVLFIGTLFYIRLTPELGLPTAAANRTQALSDALALGPRPMLLAGGFAFFGDVLLTAGCVALLTRRRLRHSDLEPFGWTLIAMGAAVAMIFDSLMAVVLEPLARLSDPGVFLAFKGWFDLLFASGNVPYGIGAIAVLVADARSEHPLLPKALAAFGIVVGMVAFVSGAGYVGGILVLPAAIGLTVTFGCLVFAILGVQIARRESSRASSARNTANLAASAVAGVRS
jgi:hypothetical protein